MPSDLITIATWNVRWTGRRSKHFSAARERIASIDADVLVLTETTFDMVPDGGHIAEGGADWGYPLNASRRKVIIWSRWPLMDVTADAFSPPGRYAAATVAAPNGPFRLHGVCIPWSHAHVTSGRRDRRAWDEHIDYIANLGDVLAAPEGTAPFVVAGDMNQRGTLRSSTPRRAREAWDGTCERARLTVVTDDLIIDKIAISEGFTATSTSVLAPDGMSDHHAVTAQVSRSAL